MDRGNTLKFSTRYRYGFSRAVAPRYNARMKYSLRSLILMLVFGPPVLVALAFLVRAAIQWVSVLRAINSP